MGREHDSLGRVVQLDPIKPTLKAAGSKRLKLKYDKLLSCFAFKFNLRRYNWGATCRLREGDSREGEGQGLTLVHFQAQPKPCWSHLHVFACLID
jgi:hypothetical protein